MKMSATIPIPFHVDEVETHKMTVLTPAEKHMKIVGEETVTFDSDSYIDIHTISSVFQSNQKYIRGN